MPPPFKGRLFSLLPFLESLFLLGHQESGNLLEGKIQMFLTVFVDLSYLNPFLWTAAEWEGCKARISPICDQKSSDRAELRLTTCSMPGMPELTEPFCPLSLFFQWGGSSHSISDKSPLGLSYRICLHSHELPSSAMVTTGSATPCLASLNIYMKIS